MNKTTKIKQQITRVFAVKWTLPVNSSQSFNVTQ